MNIAACTARGKKMKKDKVMLIQLSLLLVLSLALAIVLTQKWISLRTAPSSTGTAAESSGTTAATASQTTAGPSSQTGGTGTVTPSSQTSQTSPASSAALTVPSGFISAEQAAGIAVNQIGKGAQVTKTESEFDENPPKYELTVIYGGYRYELEIHARTGAIIDFEKKKLDTDQKSD